MSEYSIAVYIRLSMADEDTGKSKAESNSVANQRSLINRFLDCHSELSQCQRSEFCDDGFTGTNMDRPAFAEMMQRVKVGEFNLVCVKDFSRFSRDYIEIGDCLECLFPFLRVRFISINDHYDSADFVGTTGGMDVAMRNIAYAAYSKDLSMKTTSAKIQRMKQGEYMGGFAPYGFAFHPTERNKLVADPEAAEVVRRIFALAIGGSNAGKIAKILNADGIPTPGQYFTARHPDTKKFRNMSKQIAWTHEMVHSILRKQAYTGAAVGHQRKIIAPLSRQTFKQSDKDVIVVEGAHEAIVSREDFELAQSVIHNMTKGECKGRMYPLRSLIRCGDCGRVMNHNRNSTFYCQYGIYQNNGKCDSSMRYREADLEEIAFHAIQLLIQLVDKRKKKNILFDSKNAKTRQQKIRVLSGLQKQVKKYREQRLREYERYSNGAVSKSDYLAQKKALNERLSAAEEQIALLEDQLLQTEQLHGCNSDIDRAADAFVNEKNLTYEMAHAFIDAIHVFPDGRREIAWKFKDIAELLGTT